MTPRRSLLSFTGMPLLAPDAAPSAVTFDLAHQGVEVLLTFTDGLGAVLHSIDAKSFLPPNNFPTPVRPRQRPFDIDGGRQALRENSADACAFIRCAQLSTARLPVTAFPRQAVLDELFQDLPHLVTFEPGALDSADESHLKSQGYLLSMLALRAAGYWYCYHWPDWGLYADARTPGDSLWPNASRTSRDPLTAVLRSAKVERVLRTRALKRNRDLCYPGPTFFGPRDTEGQLLLPSDADLAQLRQEVSYIVDSKWFEGFYSPEAANLALSRGDVELDAEDDELALRPILTHIALLLNYSIGFYLGWTHYFLELEAPLAAPAESPPSPVPLPTVTVPAAQPGTAPSFARRIVRGARHIVALVLAAVGIGLVVGFGLLLLVDDAPKPAPARVPPIRLNPNVAAPERPPIPGQHSFKDIFDPNLKPAPPSAPVPAIHLKPTVAVPQRPLPPGPRSLEQLFAPNPNPAPPPAPVPAIRPNPNVAAPAAPESEPLTMERVRKMLEHQNQAAPDPRPAPPSTGRIPLPYSGGIE